MGGTNDKTRDSHTRETSVSRSYNDSIARNLDGKKMKNMKNTLTLRQLKKIKFILSHMNK